MGKGARTRESMIATTASLLQKQGYHGTGLKQILAESGAPRGSLYFHFPGGKEELAQHALEWSGAEMHELLSEAIDGAPNLIGALQRTVQVLAERLEASDFVEGCPIATVALESAGSEALVDACAESFRTWQALIRERLLRDGIAEAAVDPMASFVLSTIEGALLLSRTYRDTRPLRDVGLVLSGLMAQLEAAGG